MFCQYGAVGYIYYFYQTGVHCSTIDMAIDNVSSMPLNYLFERCSKILNIHVAVCKQQLHHFCYPYQSKFVWVKPTNPHPHPNKTPQQLAFIVEFLSAYRGEIHQPPPTSQ